MFTCSTAYAAFLVYNRNLERVLVFRISVHKTDGSRRAVTGTVSATHIVGIHYAEAVVHNGYTYLYGCPFFLTYRLYCSGRTYV
jgi:hypothetical protein